MKPTRTLTVTATWGGGYRCEVAARQHHIVVDEPESAHGTDTGATPTELLLASLGSCFTLALYHVAAKRNIELRSIEIAATGTYTGLAFSALDLVIHIDADADDGGIEDLIERAKAVCYVSNTLAEPPPVTVHRVARRPSSMP